MFTFPSKKQLKTLPADHWENLAKFRALELVKFMQKKVPAYSKFLGSHGIRSSINNLKQFHQLPVSDKNNYLRKYVYKELFPKDKLGNFSTISATSGSSGEEFYFPREEIHDLQYKYIAELFLKNQFGVDNKNKTLGIIGFGMGVWIGGIFTYKNFNQIALENNLTLIPTGSNVEIFLKALRKFLPMYDQVIFMGYPPFVKDVIDEAEDYGIDFKKIKVKVLTAAEGHSEKFRDYIVKKAQVKNPLTDIVNMYGTVELGTMAHETALSVLIRRFAVQNKRIFSRIFKQANRLPTLAQYHPYLIYFEELNGEVVASGYGSSIPLIRYRFPDKGGVITFDEMIDSLQSEGIDIIKEAKKAKIDDIIFRLPFVYVYDRSDHAIILRGANIYPDEIKSGLQHHQLVQHITGRFTMIKKDDSKLNEYLEVNVEMKKGRSKNKNIEELVKKSIVDELLKTNQEFSYLYSQKPLSVSPKIILWPYKYDLYFKSAGKQQWSLK